jgi:hypothetical protein
MGERFMTALMCDDVRREEGNKLSYIGIYSASLLVTQFPIVLPKLCFVLSLHTRGEDRPPNSVVFKLYSDETLLGELPIAAEQLSSHAELMLNRASNEAVQFVVGAVVQIAPFQIERPCRLKARAIVDGAELKGGAWPVEKLLAQ